jgi:hypothetical protein
MAHGRPGPAPQSEKREQFARLIVRGVSNAEACRIVGINRRTGKRWRHGRTINYQQQWPAVALSGCDQQSSAGDLGEVPVRGRAGPDRRSASGRTRRPGDRGRGGAQRGNVVREEYAAASRLLDEALALGPGNRLPLRRGCGLAPPWHVEADVQHDYAKARCRLDESLALYRTLELPRFIALLLLSLADIASAEGDHAGARAAAAVPDPDGPGAGEARTTSRDRCGRSQKRPGGDWIGDARVEPGGVVRARQTPASGRGDARDVEADASQALVPLGSVP